MRCSFIGLGRYMNILHGSSSGTARRSRQTCFPPGLNSPARSASLPPGVTKPALSASQHPLPSLAAVMGEPERRNMPLSIHNGPMKLYDSKHVLGLSIMAIVWDRRLCPERCSVNISVKLFTLKWQPMAKGEFLGLVQFQILMMNQVRLHHSLFTHVAVDGRLTTVEGVVRGADEDEWSGSCYL
ncbi:unnamed protein product [Eruca vesicaria subsp. sativa]|uniref:Uncharacterized protein n=1 Tax=Eruca vesicaria subsp. sativa TaxID=29727 RepID=A0ABC8J530_ERUVS|nr:unnamed protein product [Eruca vesicaria subsp. sativa]